MRTRMIRRSCASTSRTASPVSSSRATIRVMLGGFTCSTAASSPSVIAPEAVDRGERGETGRGEVVVAGAQGLLAHAAGEAAIGEPEPGRQHLRGDRGAGQVGRGGHDR